MKRILLTIALILTTFVFAGAKEATNDSVVREKQLQLEVLKLEHKIQLLQKENEHLKEEIIENKQDSENDVSELKENLLDKMGSYVSSFKWVGSIIVIFITFLGYGLIKRAAQKVTGDYAKKKVNATINEILTEEFIASVINERGEPEIEKLLKELEERGGEVIDGIKNKSEELFAQLSPPSNSKNVDGSTSESSERIKSITLKARALFKRAREEKDQQKKIDLYKKVLKIIPSSVEVLNNIGATYNNMCEYKKAISYLDRAINIDSSRALPYVNRAKSYNRLGEYDRSIEDTNEAIRLDPDFIFAYSEKARSLYEKDEYKEAEKVFSKLIELDPNSATAYFNRGLVNYELEWYQESLDDYFKAKDLGYDELGILYKEIAITYYALDEFEKSVKYIDKATAIDPDLSDVVIIAAEIYARAGEEKKFYKNLRMALDKGYPVWEMVENSVFDMYSDTDKFKELMKPYKDKADAAKASKTNQNNT